MIEVGTRLRYREGVPTVRPLYWGAVVRVIDYQAQRNLYKVRVEELGPSADKDDYVSQRDAEFIITTEELRRCTTTYVDVPDFTDTAAADEWMEAHGPNETTTADHQTAGLRADAGGDR